MNHRLIDNCLKVIDYLHTADEISRKFNDISFGTKLSYVQVRNCIKIHFPQCFELSERFPGNWIFTGAPLLTAPLIEWQPPAETVQAANKIPVRQPGGWQWRKEHIDSLEALFGKPISQVLSEFKAAGKLSDLSGVGKTLSRAADLTLKTGKVPDELA